LGVRENPTGQTHRDAGKEELREKPWYAMTRAPFDRTSYQRQGT
jgi:hypothetical protein